jgi:hypothetical protein
MIEESRVEIKLDNDLPQGTYFVKVFNKESIVVERIIKIN